MTTVEPANTGGGGKPKLVDCTRMLQLLASKDAEFPPTLESKVTLASGSLNCWPPSVTLWFVSATDSSSTPTTWVPPLMGVSTRTTYR